MLFASQIRPTNIALHVPNTVVALEQRQQVRQWIRLHVGITQKRIRIRMPHKALDPDHWIAHFQPPVGESMPQGV
jgi:hypothetical protein